MNIRKRFNRFAAGIGLGLAIAVPSLAQPVIPAGTNPEYLTRIYERLASRSAMPDISSAAVSSSITALTPVPDNDWLRSLKAMPPDQAETEVQGCLTSLCEHKYPFLNDSEKFVAQVIVLEAMFHRGLNDEEFRTYSQFLTQFQPSRSMQDHDKAVIESLTEKVLASSAYRNIREKLVPAAQITPLNAEEQYYLRKEFIEFVTAETRAAYSLNTVPTYLDRFPANLNGTAAVAISKNYIPEVTDNRVLLFNYNIGETNDVEKLLLLTVHEVRHTIDFDERDKALQGNTGIDDPRFTHAATIHLNQNLYIPLCATRSYGSVSCPQQHEWYRKQYVERSAVEFADNLIQKFREKIRAQQQARNLASPSV